MYKFFMDSSNQNQDQSVFMWCFQVLKQYPNVQYTKEEMDERRTEMMFEYKGASRVDYDSELTHCAYIRSDVTVHAHAISLLLSEISALHIFSSVNSDPADPSERNINTDKTVSIASIGCGPGTDMIGVIRYVMETFADPKMRPKLQFHLYDSVASWEKAIQSFVDVIRLCRPQPELELELGSDSSPIPPEFQYSFQQWDLTMDPNSFSGFNEFKNVDLFIFSTVFSDIFREASDVEKENATGNLNKLCETAKVASLFLFLDFKPTEGFALDSFLRETVLVGENFEGINFTRNYRLPKTEEKRDLGHFFSDSCHPKLSVYMDVHLYRKNYRLPETLSASNELPYFSECFPWGII